MLTAQSTAILPLILGLVQIALQIGMPRKFSPLLASALGVAAGIFYITPGDYTNGVLIGLSLGLGAVGLYSGVKNVTEGVQGFSTRSNVVAAPAPQTPQAAGQNPLPANPAQPTAPTTVVTSGGSTAASNDNTGLTLNTGTTTSQEAPANATAQQ